jgi:uncharacterized membrane protein YjjP (DUF1212 family)
MVGFAYTAVTMDTSAAEQQLDYIDRERMATNAMVEATIKEIGRKFKLTNNAIAAIQAAVGVATTVADKQISVVRAKKEVLEKEVKISTMHLVGHIFMMVTQSWDQVERAFGLSKNAASKMVGFAISGLSQMISLAWSSVATFASMGPWGLLFIGPAIAAAVSGLTSQATALGTQQSIDATPAVVGVALNGEAWTY